MNAGVAEQIGDPFEIYNQPGDAFVASFVGTLNLVRGAGDRCRDRGGWRWAGRRSSLGRPVAGATVALALRPQAVALGRGVGTDSVLAGVVRDVNFLGSVVRVRVAVEGQVVSLDLFNNAAMRPPVAGDAVEISFSAADALVTE